VRAILVNNYGKKKLYMFCCLLEIRKDSVCFSKCVILLIDKEKIYIIPVHTKIAIGSLGLNGKTTQRRK
jgi:hypothetical protein